MCVPTLSAVIRSGKIELAITDDDFVRLTTNLLKDDIGLLDETDMSPNDLRAKDDYRVKIIAPSIEGVSDMVVLSGTFLFENLTKVRI